MAKTEVQQVFDTILAINYGECVELTFPLSESADSFRSSLYRERQRWAAMSGSKDQLQITRDYSSFPFKLSISKIPGVMGVVIKKLDGTEKKIEIADPTPVVEPVAPKPTSSAPITEIEHQKALMRADGMEESEINEYFQDDEE